ncbi:hypothetical protein ABZY14_15370 [Streptomyces sp. NPDC006617]
MPVDDALWLQLDECLLSAAKHREFVAEPLRAFFGEVFSARISPDLTAV